MKVIFGLGNPGRTYSKTRHNLGFMVLDRLAEKYSLSFSRRLFKTLLAEGVIRDYSGEPGTALFSERVVLARPQTYMNLSGESVFSIYKWYKVNLEDIIVICDDFSLPAGTLRFRPKGGAGGHNGLRSIISCLGTKDFLRLKIGIGIPDRDPADFVLSRLSNEELKNFEHILDIAVESIIFWMKNDACKAMNFYNRSFNP